MTAREGSSSWGVNQLTEAQWSLLEQQGAVFLPAAGGRNGTSVYNTGAYGNYWSSTINDASRSTYYLDYSSGFVAPLYVCDRNYGFSVRLVCPAE